MFFSLFCNTKVQSQILAFDSNEKKLLKKYIGGRKKYSKVSIKLYSDSTYEYSIWYHFGQTEKDSGTYLITDTSLILFSKSYSISNKLKKVDKPYTFTGEQYRIQNKKLLLFTQKQEKEDVVNFYRLYFTLDLVE